MIFSYSAIKTYNTCPRQYEALHLLKTHKRESSPALEKGIEFHKKLEDAIRDGKGLPQKLKSWEVLASKLHQGGAVPERKMAVDRNLQPCDFFDDHAWIRGVIDVDFEVGNTCLQIDWKTGKVRPDALQADFYALLKWAQNPNLTIDFKFAFLEHNVVHPVHPTTKAKDEVPAMVSRIEMAEEFPPTPSFLCRYCPVYECEHNEA